MCETFRPQKNLFSVHSATCDALLWLCVGTVTGRWMSRQLQGDYFFGSNDHNCGDPCTNRQCHMDSLVIHGFSSGTITVSHQISGIWAKKSCHMNQRLL